MEAHPSPTRYPKSDAIGIILIAFLWLGVGATALSLVSSLIDLAAPDIYASIEVFDGINSLVQIVLTLISIVLFLVWMYKLHADLRVLFKPYPITPGAALAQLMIPIYNLWGIWNVFSTLAVRLNSSGGTLADGGGALKFWLPLLYITMFASRILNRLILIQSRSPEEAPSQTLILVSVGVDLFLSIIWLEMAKVICQAAKYRATEVENQRGPEGNPAMI